MMIGRKHLLGEIFSIPAPDLSQRHRHLSEFVQRIRDSIAEETHEELAVTHPEAGDIVLTHNGLLHSGTPNGSGQKRYFFSVYYNLSWMKHTDTFDGPNCQQLKRWARKRNDHRSLRLLGQDDYLQARGNSGFQDADEPRWERWIAEERELLIDDR